MRYMLNLYDFLSSYRESGRIKPAHKGPSIIMPL